jgi:hypothetical protein
MPLEGHWERVNTPLRRLTRRERFLAIVAAAVTLIALLVYVVAAVGGSSLPKPGPGCISAAVPGVMGGMRVEACGGQARTLCAEHATQSDPGSRSIQASCRRAGLL